MNWSIGGAEVASTAINLNLVDEIYAFIFPVVIDGGRKWISAASLKTLNLGEVKRFEDGVLRVHYTTKIG